MRWFSWAYWLLPWSLQEWRPLIVTILPTFFHFPHSCDHMCPSVPMPPIYSHATFPHHTHISHATYTFPRHPNMCPVMCLAIMGLILTYLALTCTILFAQAFLWFLSAVPRLIITFLWLVHLWLTRSLLILYSFPNWYASWSLSHFWYLVSQIMFHLHHTSLWLTCFTFIMLPCFFNPVLYLVSFHLCTQIQTQTCSYI